MVAVALFTLKNLLTFNLPVLRHIVRIEVPEELIFQQLLFRFVGFSFICTFTLQRYSCNLVANSYCYRCSFIANCFGLELYKQLSTCCR